MCRTRHRPHPPSAHPDDHQRRHRPGHRRQRAVAPGHARRLGPSIGTAPPTSTPPARKPVGNLRPAPPRCTATTTRSDPTAHLSTVAAPEPPPGGAHDQILLSAQQPHRDARWVARGPLLGEAITNTRPRPGPVGQQRGQHSRQARQHRWLLATCCLQARADTSTAGQHRRHRWALLGSGCINTSADQAVVGHLVSANTASRARGPPAP